MHIIDIEGNRIAVTDLKRALTDVDGFRRMRHMDAAHAAGDRERQRY